MKALREVNYWRDIVARQGADEVAEEMAKLLTPDGRFLPSLLREAKKMAPK